MSGRRHPRLAESRRVGRVATRRFERLATRATRRLGRPRRHPVRATAGPARTRLCARIRVRGTSAVRSVFACTAESAPQCPHSRPTQSARPAAAQDNASHLAPVSFSLSYADSSHSARPRSTAGLTEPRGAFGSEHEARRGHAASVPRPGEKRRTEWHVAGRQAADRRTGSPGPAGGWPALVQEGRRAKETGGASGSGGWEGQRRAVHFSGWGRGRAAGQGASESISVARRSAEIRGDLGDPRRWQCRGRAN